ncbi:hypothetical protein PO909_011578 [Leuciscus waleckii]
MCRGQAGSRASWDGQAHILDVEGCNCTDNTGLTRALKIMGRVTWVKADGQSSARGEIPHGILFQQQGPQTADGVMLPAGGLQISPDQDMATWDIRQFCT